MKPALESEESETVKLLMSGEKPPEHRACGL